jgi:tetratricopeptide (TPR) repeat protein
MAGVLLSLHRFVEAEALLQALCAAQPDDPALRFNLGLALYYQQRWADALAAFDGARDAGLRHRDLPRYRAGALHHRGRLDEAIEACNAWLADEPGTAARAYLAVLEMDRGDLPAAQRRAEAVLAENPDDPDAALVAGMCMTERQEIDGARRHFERLLALEPDNARGWFGIGLTHMYRQEHAQAIAAIERALVVTPGHVGTLVTLGWAKFTARDVLGAEQVFRRAIAADRNFGEAHGGLAMTLIYQSRITEARRETAIARRLNPHGFGGTWAHGALLGLEGRRAQGEAEVAALLERRVTSDGRSLLEHVQVFVRGQAARTQAKAARLPSTARRNPPP